MVPKIKIKLNKKKQWIFPNDVWDNIKSYGLYTKRIVKPGTYIGNHKKYKQIKKIHSTHHIKSYHNNYLSCSWLTYTQCMMLKELEYHYDFYNIQLNFNMTKSMFEFKNLKIKLRNCFVYVRSDYDRHNVIKEFRFLFGHEIPIF